MYIASSPNWRHFIISLFFLLIVHVNSAKDVFKIGFSQCTTDDLWRETMQREMLIELAFYPDIQFKIKDAQNDTENQIRQIKEFLREGIDLLIVSPNESEPLSAVVESVFKQGIPVIVIDRKIISDSYTAFVGADNYNIGQEAGRYAARLLKGKGNIFEISGLPGSSPAIDRHNGFFDVIELYPDLKVIRSGAGNWNASDARAEMKKALLEVGFDLIYAHNDVMAKGAYLTAKELNREKDFFYLGIDGLSGQEGGIQYVMDRMLDATFLYPTGGKEALNIAHKILHKLPFERENILETVVVDSTNAKVIKLQTEQVVSLQGKIESQKDVLDVQISKYQSQQLLLIIVVIMLFANVILVVSVFRAFRTKIRANVVLEKQKGEIEKQNVEIISQRDKLIEVSNQLEEATQAKLRFFTNISHEIRTPLTLIAGPLEDLIQSKNYSEKQKRRFELMHLNTQRLLKLINQLMDFRKLENVKMRLEAGQYDLIAFLEEIHNSFDSLATRKSIRFTFEHDIKELSVWYDWDKMDKVVFNLLSNAFKFTSEGGKIAIKVRTVKLAVPLEYDEELILEVSDTGKGIPKEHLSKIFDRFYQVGKDDSIKGTGLGLTLSKGFVELHHGKLEVESTPGKGTSFLIHLPLGKNHLFEDEILKIQNKDIASNHEELIELSLNIDNVSEEKTTRKFADKAQEKPVVLIVEDHHEVREYIKESLGNDYVIFEAENGKQGILKVEEEGPDLVISDIMMPEMDGLEMTRRLKTDIKTCHIPIILLTARSSEEQKFEGLEEGADSYIPKPFNSRHLQIRVRKLLELRSKLQERYRGIEIVTEEEGQISRLDRKFLNKITSIVENNLNKEDLSVEDIGAMIGLSRVHLYRKIKNLTGMSVSEFVRLVKLRLALPLLKNSGKSISEIAYEVGFSSPSYFTKCFKEQFGVSPSEYA